MAVTRQKIFFGFSGLNLVGGVVKLMDYLRHALDCGLEAGIVVNGKFDASLPLFDLPSFRSFASWGVPMQAPSAFRIAEGDYFFFSWPSNFAMIEPRLPWMNTKRVIHIVQGVRHIDPDFLNGYALRLLSRPMTRIAISDHLCEAIAPHVNRSSILRTIPLAHYTDFFERDRLPEHWHCPIRIAYATWKSDHGTHVQEAIADDKRFEFRGIRGRVSWHDLRAIYHWADVFLCFPHPKEGFYLPGLEAMAAQCIVVTPDVIGNREYCSFGTNCIPTEWGNIASYLAALDRVASMTVAERTAMQAAGSVTARSRRLSEEREAFADLLTDLENQGQL
jgi:hypothetical protein